MVGPRGEGYLTLIQGWSEFMNHVPTILNSWDCPPLGHLQHSTSLPHPAAVAVITGRATRLPLTWSLPPRGVPPSQGCPSIPGVSRSSHQMRTPRYFPFNSFLWNSQQQKPSLSLCLFTVAKPTPQIPTPPGDLALTGPQEEPRRCDCSAQTCTILQLVKSQQVTINRFPCY